MEKCSISPELSDDSRDERCLRGHWLFSSDGEGCSHETELAVCANGCSRAPVRVAQKLTGRYTPLSLTTKCKSHVSYSPPSRVTLLPPHGLERKVAGESDSGHPITYRSSYTRRYPDSWRCGRSKPTMPWSPRCRLARIRGNCALCRRRHRHRQGRQRRGGG